MDEKHLDIKTPEYVSLQFEPAGLGSRAAAHILDQLILVVANIVIVVIGIFVLMGLNNPTPIEFLPYQLGSLPFAIMIILLFVVNWGYFLAFEYFAGGRTPGKYWLGIRVIQGNGQSITLLSSFIRNLMRIIDMLPAYYLVGIIMVFFHSQHKRLGDIVAGTIVVHERKKKRKKKQTPIEKEMELRGITKDGLVLEEYAIKALGTKEWKLLKAYSQRFVQLPVEKRNQLTKQLAELLLPKIGINPDQKEYELERILLTLYVILKDEWEFEL